jgi:hypothetical protein
LHQHGSIALKLAASNVIKGCRPRQRAAALLPPKTIWRTATLNCGQIDQMVTQAQQQGRSLPLMASIYTLDSLAQWPVLGGSGARGLSNSGKALRGR